MTTGQTIAVVAGLGALAVVGYIVYKRYNPTASKSNNTVLTDIGFGAAAFNQIAPGLKSLFSSGSGGGSGTFATDTDAEF